MGGKDNPGPRCQGHRFETVYDTNIKAIQPQHRKPRRKTTCNLTAPLSVDFFQSAGTQQCLLAKQSPIIEISRDDQGRIRGNVLFYQTAQITQLAVAMLFL